MLGQQYLSLLSSVHLLSHQIVIEVIVVIVAINVAVIDADAIVVVIVIGIIVVIIDADTTIIVVGLWVCISGYHQKKPRLTAFTDFVWCKSMT